MRSDKPKVLHKIGNSPMLHHVMDVAKKLGQKEQLLLLGIDLI